MDPAKRTGEGSTSHWLIERRVRVYPRLVLGVILLVVPLYALTFEAGLDDRGRPMGTDFIAFWSAARASVDGQGIDPWNLQQLADFQRSVFPGLNGPTAWVYPPATLLLVWPLGHLSYPVAFAAWTIVGLIAYLACVGAVVRGRRLAWPLVLAFPGLWLGIAQGQTQFFVAALVGGAVLLLARRPVLAGVLIGLLVIKPHLAILFPLVLAASGQWRAFAAAAATATTTLAISAAAFGPASIGQWFEGMGLIGEAIDQAALPVHKFVTPYTAFQLLGLGEAAALVLHVCVAAPSAWVVWRIWRDTTDVRLRGASLVLGTFLVTPYAADYDLAVLALPIAWIALAGLDGTWLRGDRNLLVAAWVLPVVAAPLAALTHVSVTPVVVALLLGQVWRRVGAVEPDTEPDTEPQGEAGAR